MQQAATVMAARPFPSNGVVGGMMGYEGSFEPQTRARSNTWPCPRPEMIKEEVEEETGVELLLENELQGSHLQHQHQLGQMPNAGTGLMQTGLTPPNSSVLTQSQLTTSTIPEYTSTTSPATVGGALGVGQLVKKSTSSRRNAWGNMSYADLITQAIGSSAEKRLTLSQIYDWMVVNVPYFKDKGDSNSSAGWKNSIRHNLSLHNRFMRVQNEGTGKSSWWMLNPDAKPGKAARRRATSMETSKFEKKRGRIRKKLENLRNGIMDSPCSSVSEGLESFPGSSVDELGHYQGPGSSANLSPEYRPRASSNASSCGGRISPVLRESDLHDNQVPPMSPWAGDYYSTTAHYDRYMADETLAGSLANTMKLGEPVQEFNYHSPTTANDQSYSGVQQHQQFQRNTLREQDYTSYIPYNAQNGSDGRGNMGVSTITNGSLGEPDAKDLDFIEQIESTFDCNVDEVLQNELSLDGNIDFNFGNVGAHQVLAHAHLQQQHQAQQQPSMLFGQNNSTLHHHLMNSPLMGSNGSGLLTTGRGNNPNVTVAPTPNTSGRPWVH